MRAAIYARYSSDKQRESSIDDQARNCTARAAREGFTTNHLYKDEAVSGASSARAGYQKLLAAAFAGEFDVLLVDDLSRLSRDDYEMKGALRRLIYAGIRIIGVSDGYDSASKGHKIQSSIHGLMSEVFLDGLRDKTHRGMAGQALKGFKCGGRTYGYSNIPIEDPMRTDPYGRAAIVAVRYDIDQVQADIVRKIFAWYAAGKSYTWIAAELNRMRVPASRGNTWAMSAIKVILDNEMYEGRVTWNRTEWIKHPDTGKRTYKSRPKSEWIIHENPELRIIAAEVIAAVRQRQCKNRASYSELQAASRQSYLFSGLLVCAGCGARFTVTGQNRYGCAAHKSRGPTVCDNSLTVSRHIVEERLLHGIKERLLTPDAMERFKRAAVKAIEDHKKTDQAETFRHELKAAQRTHQNIMGAIRAGILTDSTKEALESAEKDIAGLERKIQHAEHGNLSGILPRALERYQQAINGLGREFEGRVSEAREILRSLMGENIRIHRRGDHLEAELQNNVSAVLSKMMGVYSDSVGCGGVQCSESEYISLESRLSDNTPLSKRNKEKRAAHLRLVVS